MISEEDLKRMAIAVRTHLSQADAQFVATQASIHAEQWSVLMSAHGGMKLDEVEFASLCLRIAKRCALEGGAS